jgi:prolipoprotein diacylglyceryl transferase
MFAIGFWIGYEVVSRIFKREGEKESWLSYLLIYTVVATIIGARLGHVLFYDWSYYKDHLSEIFMVWRGGLASHGGTLGIIIAIYFFSKFVTKRPMLWTFDRLVVPVGLVGALIRFGNLMNSEIYGGPTTLPWGMKFARSNDWWVQYCPDGILANGFACHPTQIYEALCYLALFGLCMYMYWKRNCQEREGLIFGVFLLGIFVPRFIIEYVKNVQEVWELGLIESCGMNMGQLLSVPFIIAGIWLVIRAMRRPRVPLQYPNRFAPENKK